MERLRQSEQRLQLALEATELAVYKWDLVSDRLTANQRFRELLGFGSDEAILGARVMEHFVHQVGAELATLLGVGNNNLSLEKDNLRSNSVNGLAGLGINIGLLTLDAVYNHGLANVYENSTLDSKRRMFELNVGVRI